jgi:hypothetical protein
VCCSTATVTHTVEVTRKGSKKILWITGAVTITNPQKTPYPLSGVQLALFDPEDTTAGASPISVNDVKCESFSNGLMLLPPQGTVECTFEVSAKFAAAAVLAQAKTAGSGQFDLFSANSLSYDFQSTSVVDAKSGSCANVGSTYPTSLAKYGADLLQPAAVVGGTMPQAANRLLARPECGSRNYTWVVEYSSKSPAGELCGEYTVSTA